MRTLMLAPAALTILALTAVSGLNAGSVPVGGAERAAPTDVQKHRVSSGGLGGIAHQGFLRDRNHILVKGDMSGMGGGAGMGKGGMKGDMMGGMGMGKGKDK